LFPAAAPAGVPDRPVTVNFHPYRLVAGGRSVAQCLAAEGVYRNQFETGISNGGIGDFRDRWEQRMFPGCYSGRSGRPVYGGWNLAGWPDGAAPRFGSCHLVLASHVAQRATFSHGDSVTEPAVVGTAATFGAVWQALLDEVAATGRALHLPAASPGRWVAALGEPRTAAGRALDGYVEAQIHGGLTLGGDVTAIVVDPAFRGTPYEGLLAATGVPLRWAPGFRLPAAAFPADLRGPEVPPLARAVAERFGRPVLDAEVLGRAAAEPGAPLQLIKYLWHILVILGEPAAG
jgi:hypothetical protein